MYPDVNFVKSRSPCVPNTVVSRHKQQHKHTFLTQVIPTTFVLLANDLSTTFNQQPSVTTDDSKLNKFNSKLSHRSFELNPTLAHRQLRVGLFRATYLRAPHLNKILQMEGETARRHPRRSQVQVFIF